MSQFEIIYVRFQDFDRKSYVASQIELCRAFIQHGYRTKLIGLGKKKRPEEFIEFYSDAEKPQLKKLMLMLHMLKFRKRKAIIVFDVFSVISGILLHLFRLLFGSQFRIVLDVRTIPVERDSIKAISSFRRNLKTAKLFCDGFTFITPGVRRMSELYTGKKYAINHIFPSGTNTDVFKPVHARTENDVITIFHHGSLTANRGVLQLLEAIEDMKCVKLIIAGAGDEKTVNRIKNSGNVEYLGKVDYQRIPELIADSDFTVIPLPDILWWRVSSPLKLMEYMACAKPILLTDMEAHRNVLKNDRGVVWLRDIKIETIRTGIKDMTESLEIKTREAAYLRQEVENKYTYMKMAVPLLDFYKRLI